MVAGEMLFSVRDRLNKLDSMEYQNLPVPVIDMRLNEAVLVLVQLALKQRVPDQVSQIAGAIDLEDIRTLIVQSKELGVQQFDENSVTAELPEDFWNFVKGYVKAAWRGCERKIRIYPQKHDEEFEESPNTRSSYVFERSNGVLVEGNKIRLYHGGDFEISAALLDYIRRPAYIHNADKWRGGSYARFDGTALSGSQDCDLPEQVHSKIVDIAVLNIRGDLGLPEYQAAIQKLNLLN